MNKVHRVLTSVVGCTMLAGAASIYAQQGAIIKPLTPGEARQREMQEYDRGSGGPQRREAEAKRVEAEKKIAVDCKPLLRGWQFKTTTFGESSRPIMQRATLVKISPLYAWFVMGNKTPSQIARDKNLQEIPILRTELPHDQQVLVWEKANAALRINPEMKDRWPVSSLERPKSSSTKK